MKIIIEIEHPTLKQMELLNEIQKLEIEKTYELEKLIRKIRNHEL